MIIYLKAYDLSLSVSILTLWRLFSFSVNVDFFIFKVYKRRALDFGFFLVCLPYVCDTTVMSFSIRIQFCRAPNVLKCAFNKDTIN